MYAGLLNPQRGDAMYQLGQPNKRPMQGLLQPDFISTSIGASPQSTPMGGLLGQMGSAMMGGQPGRSIDFNAIAQQLAGPRVDYQAPNPFPSPQRPSVPGNAESNFRDMIAQQLISGFGMPSPVGFGGFGGGGFNPLGVNPRDLPSAYTRML